MKPGTKLRSAVSDAEVLVVKTDAKGVVSCGGAPMVELPAEARSALDPAYAGGVLVGKRYQNSTGTTELLCIKAGVGALSIDGVLLTIKATKPLPSSD